MAIAARIPMIATTISSSIRVKPFSFFLNFFNIVFLLEWMVDAGRFARPSVSNGNNLLALIK
jgi:hypothetical protein